MSIFIEVGEYIVETSEIKTGECVVERKNGHTKRVNDLEYFEVSFHEVIDPVGLKKKTKCYHVYSENNELPLSYKLRTVRELLREASVYSKQHAIDTLEYIQEVYFRGNDPFDPTAHAYLVPKE